MIVAMARPVATHSQRRLPCARKDECMLTPWPYVRDWAYEISSSGEMRMAAPVGQERTQAAPPEMPLHMSHFTAFLPTDSAFFAYGDSPGPGPAPNASHDNSPGFFA